MRNKVTILDDHRKPKHGVGLTPEQYRSYLAGGPYRIVLTPEQKEEILRQYIRGIALQELKRVDFREILEELERGQ